MTDPAADNFRWAGRPLRNLSDKELQTAIKDRETSLKTATNKIGQQLAAHALERLQREYDGRRNRVGK